MKTISHPYEYALLSQLSYSDDPATSKPLTEPYFSFNTLQNIGWKLQDQIAENDYHAHIWVNENTEQVVIAHRGSQNATSWITDVESVIRLEPGTFINAALGTLFHPTVIDLRNKGYRLSTTGHSLGGFLAQVCVFWSQRREFKETYYPDMSAMTFDSPGVVEFAETIQSNLRSEKNSISLEMLNIHNFCAMPTIVSTYGTQTGTIWHLSGAENIQFAFVNDHRMMHILAGFDSQTGQPVHFRQMTDWPQADYSQYESFTSTVEHLVGETVKIPFLILNALYKKIRRNQTDTWFDKLFREQGEVATFLASNNYRPDLNSLQQQMTSALRHHYTSFKTEEESKARIGIQHFDLQLQIFLTDLAYAKNFNLSYVDIEQSLKAYCGDYGWYLLNQCELMQFGNKLELVLSPEYKNSVFTYEQELLAIFQQKEVPSVQALVGEKVKEFGSRLGSLEKQTEEFKRLSAEIKSCQDFQQNAAIRSKEINLRTAIGKASDTNAWRFLGPKDYESDRVTKEIGTLVEENPSVSTFNVDSAIAETPGVDAIVAGPKLDNSQLKLFELGQKYKASRMMTTFGGTQQPQKEESKSSKEEKKSPEKKQGIEFP